MLKIKPQPLEVLVKVDEAQAGALNMESVKSAVEFGTVMAIGDEVKSVKVGKKIMFKAWSTDIVNVDGVRYIFINVETNGIKGTIND